MRTTLPEAPPAVADLSLLLARIGLGVILIAHGWQKWDEMGIDGVRAGFSSMGIPAPEVAAYFVTGVELIGGVLLIVGLFTQLAGVLVAATMAGAWWFAHRGNGIFVTDGGWELVGALGLLALVLAAVGPGRYAFDARGA